VLGDVWNTSHGFHVDLAVEFGVGDRCGTGNEEVDVARGSDGVARVEAYVDLLPGDQIDRVDVHWVAGIYSLRDAAAYGKGRSRHVVIRRESHRGRQGEHYAESKRGYREDATHVMKPPVKTGELEIVFGGSIPFSRDPDVILGFTAAR
jgi:hypothetical protein